MLVLFLSSCLKRHIAVALRTTTSVGTVCTYVWGPNCRTSRHFVNIGVRHLEGVLQTIKFGIKKICVGSSITYVFLHDRIQNRYIYIFISLTITDKVKKYNEKETIKNCPSVNIYLQELLLRMVYPLF